MNSRCFIRGVKAVNTLLLCPKSSVITENISKVDTRTFSMSTLRNKHNTHAENRQIFLRSRPGVNEEPSEENFGLRALEMPLPDPDTPGHLLIKNLYLSIDPALRCRMNEDSGVEYMSSWQLNRGVDGLGGVGEVEASSDPTLRPGDLVMATFLWPWTNFFTIDSTFVKKLPRSVFGAQPYLALSVLGVTGLTAYLGLLTRAHLSPGSGQTVVISAAAGATGSIAGQIARLLGAERVVGICGSKEKCHWLTSDLGFDAAINYKADNVASSLAKFCPKGIHVYFDNVGGALSETVIPQMVKDSHVILCGQIAVYNTDLPYPPPISPSLEQLLKDKNITRERFLVLQYTDKFESAFEVLLKWHQDGLLKTRETIEDGLENAGKAFVSMMKGGNIGKQLVQVNSSSWGG